MSPAPLTLDEEAALIAGLRRKADRDDYLREVAASRGQAEAEELRRLIFERLSPTGNAPAQPA